MNSKLNIVHLTPSCSRQAGGLFFSVKFLSDSLASRECDLGVIAGHDEFTEEDIHTWPNRVRPTTLQKYKPYAFSFMPDLEQELEARSPDIVHIHGVWSYHAWAALNWARKDKRRKLVISPRGMFDVNALKISRLKKWFAFNLYVRRLIERCDMFHALNDNEASSIRRLVGSQKPIATIPNGMSFSERDRSERRTPNVTERSVKEIVFLGRIHPKKGLEDFICALPHVKRHRNINVRIAGWGDSSYIRRLKRLCHDQKVNEFVEFSGPKYGTEKLEFLETSDIFVLPSYSEGLPMAVLDAWKANVFTLVTSECNFGDLEGLSFAKLITHDPRSMAKVIIESIDYVTTVDLSVQRESIHTFLRSRYSWEKISEDMMLKYQELV